MSVNFVFLVFFGGVGDVGADARGHAGVVAMSRALAGLQFGPTGGPVRRLAHRFGRRR